MPRGDVCSQGLSPRYRREMSKTVSTFDISSDSSTGGVSCVVFANMTLQAHEIPSVLLDTRKELLGCGIADLIRDAYL
jgi:hypothetical protein